MSAEAAAAEAIQSNKLYDISIISLAVVGLLTLAVISFRVSGFLFNRYFYSNKSILLPLYGTWACVTGATDGIGREIALELAKRGFNIVIISRDMGKLEQTSNDIKKQYPNVNVKIIQVDFSDFNADVRKRVSQELSDISAELGILVNNVGKSYDHPMRFHELTDDQVHDLIELNINSTTWMTRIVLPFMIERSARRKKSSIINIGSAASVQTNPMLAEYSASKSYIQLLSQALDAEYKSMGIEVVCHTPYFIVSKLSKLRKATLFVPTPTTYAKLVVKAIGSGATVLNPYIPHALTQAVLTSLPESLLRWIVLDEHTKLYKRAMAKKNAAPKEGDGKDIKKD